jgi:hypothetical protein
MFPSIVYSFPAFKGGERVDDGGKQEDASCPSTSSGTNILKSNFKGHHILNYVSAYAVCKYPLAFFLDFLV